MSTLGIKKIFEINNTTPTKIASRIGVDKSIITNWINGKAEIPNDKLEILSNLFHVNKDWFQRLLTKDEIESIDRVIPDDVIIPKNDGNSEHFKLGLTILHAAGGGISESEFKNKYSANAGKNLSKESLSHKFRIYKYFNLAYQEKKMYYLTDYGKRYCESNTQEDKIKILFESLDSWTILDNGRPILPFRPLIKPPLLLLKMAYDLSETGVKSKEFSIMLYLLHNKEMNYEEAIKILPFFSDEVLKSLEQCIRKEGFGKYFDPKLHLIYEAMGIFTCVKGSFYLTEYVHTNYSETISSYNLYIPISASKTTMLESKTQNHSADLVKIINNLSNDSNKFCNIKVNLKDVTPSTFSSEKTSTGSKIPSTSNSTNFSQEELNNLGWYGEACIYYNLINNNTDLLEKLHLAHSEIITDITWFNYGFDKSEDDWTDKSVGKGCDIVVETTLRTLYIEVKTSFSNTNFYTVTRNELRAMEEHSQNYFLIKINNFKMFSSTDTKYPTLTIIQNPIQLKDYINTIKDITFFN